MSAQRIELALQGVADKILHDLPEELAAVLSFNLHEGGDSLVLTYPKGLHGTPDMQFLDGVVRRHGAAFVSRGKNTSYYLIPKSKMDQPAATEVPKKAEASKPVDSKTAEPKPLPEKPASPPIEKKLGQPSPLSTFKSQVCRACSEVNSCNVEQMKLCFFVLEMEALADISRLLEKLADIPLALGDLSAQLSMLKQSQPKLPAQPSQQPQPPKAQRETNPREGFEEDGLVWVKVFDGANIKFLKAYEKDNHGRQRFKELSDWIAKKGDKPFAKQFFLGVECQVFLWNFNQGPVAIGKSKCKTKEQT